MKNKELYGHPLTEQEAKQVMGGHVFPVSEFYGICPACRQKIEIITYSYVILCPHCGGQIILEEKDEE